MTTVPRKWDLYSSMHRNKSDPSFFPLWDVWRRRMRTIQWNANVWHTQKQRQCYSTVCVGVEGVSYQTALKRKTVCAAHSSNRTVLIRLHSLSKPAENRMQLQSAEVPLLHTEKYPIITVIYNTSTSRRSQLNNIVIKHNIWFWLDSAVIAWGFLPITSSNYHSHKV